MIVPKLPTELWLEILRLALPERNLKRILRLRLVNRLFASAIMDMLPGHPLLSAYLSNRTCSSDPRPPVSLEAAHLHHFLNSGKEVAPLHHLAIVKETAIALAEADITGRTVDDFLTILCPLAVSKYKEGSIWWRPNMYWNIYFPRDRHSPVFLIEVFIAALHTQVPSVIEDMCQKNTWQWDNGYSILFGNAYEAVAGNVDNHHIIKAFALNDRFAGNTRRAFLRYAVQHGDLDLVKLIWNHNTDKFPWTFAQSNRESYDGHRNNKLLAQMQTPNVQVFEWLMEKRRMHCVGKTFGDEQWRDVLVSRAAVEPIDLAKHYMELAFGYEANGTRMWSPPLNHAVTFGHRDVVELFLAHGAKVDKYSLEAAIKRGDVDVAEVLLKKGVEDLDIRATITLAVRKGHARMVRMLFEHCPDAGQIGQELLVHAVRMENEEVVRILVEEAGGVIAEDVRGKCLNACREEGLESMERLLMEY